MSLFNYECDETKRIIDEVSPNYPQLTTYEKEWIFFHKYHYIPGIPVDLEWKEVIVKPTGTVQNAIPYQYKRAILKGDTKYRDIDTGDILDTFDETKNLELVSVKMPVLTTTGKNLFDKNTMKTAWWIDNKTVHKDSGNSAYSIIVPITENKIYSVSFSKKSNRSLYAFLDKDYNTLLINSNSYTTTTSPYGSRYLIYYLHSTDLELCGDIQLEEDTGATSYEPFKSNIFTVNEDVKLRGIGDVKDELDLMTGELTERIGEFVLDGTQYMVSDGYGVYIQVNDVKRFIDYTDKIACDKLPVIPTYRELENVENGISGFSNSGSYLGQNWLYVKINNSVNTDEVKEWLTQKPITVQYQHAQESIKTVGLTKLPTPYDGTNHYHLTTNIPCEGILEVPVVSTGEQTISEINNY